MILNEIHLKRESKSFTDAMYAVLTAAGRFDGPKFMLSGLSGLAFKFSVHDRLLPMSVTAYGHWGTEHQAATDNLGVFTVTDGGRTRHPSFEIYQQDAVEGVKKSIEAGIGVVYWLPEFGVIHGYDEEDRVFYVQDGWSGETHVVLYDNFGINMTPFWYYQAFGKGVAIPLKAAVLESLRLALQDWEIPYKTRPDTSIASGRLAYQYVIQALEQGDFDRPGATYIIDSYVYSRREIRDYLSEVKQLLPGLDRVHSLYAELISIFTEECVASLLRSQGELQLEEDALPAWSALFVRAEALEARAMALCRTISERYPDPTRSILPRWGAHTAR